MKLVKEVIWCLIYPYDIVIIRPTPPKLWQGYKSFFLFSSSLFISITLAYFSLNNFKMAKFWVNKHLETIMKN